jgi:hypothetical protein
MSATSSRGQCPPPLSRPARPFGPCEGAKDPVLAPFGSEAGSQQKKGTLSRSAWTQECARGEGVMHAQHRVRPATVSRCVARCRPAEYRVWVKATADRYPVNLYLHQCQLVPSPHCPYCPGQNETLAHFTTICPRFQEARTAGHNRVRAKLASLLAKCLDTQWQLFEETLMRSTGLKVQTVSAACMMEAGRLPPGDHGDSICVGNLQPDLV